MNRRSAVLLSILLLPTAIVPAAADDEPEDLNPLRCISMGRVRTTTILDDGNILFHERGGRVYLNALDRQCIGLARSGKFRFDVQGSARYVRLCDSDTITVLATSNQGFTCGLGRFQPLSSSVAEQLLNPERAASGQPVITAEPVELPPEPAATAPPDAPRE